MPAGWVAAAAVVGGVVAGNQQSKAAKKAANTQADASRDAAELQAQSAREAIEFQKETRDLVRGDLQPFRDIGQQQLTGLNALINHPTAQLDYVQNNPFFKSLADDAQNRLFSNQAAKGKIGSGGTAQALQNSLLLLGQDLINNNIAQKTNLATIGQNAAAQQASGTQQIGNSISDLLTGSGNARAAGIIGAGNAQAAGIIGVGNARAQTIRDITQIGGSYFGGYG